MSLENFCISSLPVSILIPAHRGACLEFSNRSRIVLHLLVRPLISAFRDMCQRDVINP